MSISIADCHADTLSRLLILDDEYQSLYLPQPRHQSDLPRMRQGGVRLQVFSIFTMPYEAGHYGAVRSLQMMQIYRNDVARHADLVMVESAADLDDFETSAKTLYGLFSMEGAS
ncbi:MAG: membrane dipeptidase, partial [Candidatus Sericytochromatia bacterium]